MYAATPQHSPDSPPPFNPYMEGGSYGGMERNNASADGDLSSVNHAGSQGGEHHSASESHFSGEHHSGSESQLRSECIPASIVTTRQASAADLGNGPGAFHGPPIRSPSAASVLGSFRYKNSAGHRSNSTLGYKPLEDDLESHEAGKVDERGFAQTTGSSPTGFSPPPPPPLLRKQRTCCSLRCRPQCWGPCLLITIVILAGLGVAGFFLFPRIPSVDISTPFLPAGPELAAFQAESAKWTPGVNTIGSLTTASAAAPFVLDIGVGVNISVASENYVGYRINQLTVVGFLKDVNNKVIDTTSAANQLQATSVITDARIAPRTTSILSLPISINYTVTTPLTVASVINDPVLAVLARACGLPGIAKVPGATINLHVTSTIDLRAISWTGYKPKIEKDVSFVCPDAVASALGGVFSEGEKAVANAISAGIAGANNKPPAAPDATARPTAEDVPAAAAATNSDSGAGGDGSDQ
ncbi:hypothetical protein HDU87_002650 [Geranomyces variabilis]|uniref:Uncharacterized protein n=1 Tax=Geranomyces variabilis TaxID=109894 RepID=A0AAD5TRY4_9FUNG|nr:hypothetical protein HDU87_002650 [Geranomyces variabilis]